MPLYTQENDLSKRNNETLTNCYDEKKAEVKHDYI